MTQNVMPENIWIKVQEGHHERYLSVCSVPATEHTEYIPASSLTSLRSENEKMRELLKECVAKKEMDGAYPGGCSCGICQEWRDLITRISHFTEKEL